MKDIGPIKVFFLLLFVSVFLLLLLFASPFYQSNDDVLMLPSSRDFLPLEVEKVSTVYGKKDPAVFVEVGQENEDVKQGDQVLFTPVHPDEKIIHSSDFKNDLRFFYQSLNELTVKDALIRVLHFGDSQIEGDRVSGKLRASFQDLFGGCGTGFMPFSEHRVQRLNVQKYVSGWERYKVFGSKPDGRHNKYGFMGYYHKMDSIKKQSYIQIKKKRKYFKGVNRADKLSILYKAPIEYTGLDVLLNRQKQAFSDDRNEGLVHKRSWTLDSFPRNDLNLVFELDTVAEFYGLALDCEKGIAVDNVGLRGSSGTEFTKIDEVNLRDQLNLLKVKLIVYQFGVNIIPYLVDDYGFYEKMVLRQLKLFKKLAPQAAILVVGVSDMCQKKDGKIKSFPNIKKVISAQRNAALIAGCAFWDLQKVMGGEGSMLNWVNAEPPLGEKDYTHFNKRGADLVGEKLFNAIMADYNAYRVLQ